MSPAYLEEKEKQPGLREFAPTAAPTAAGKALLRLYYGAIKALLLRLS